MGRVKLAADKDGDVDERPVTRYAEAPDGVRIAYQVAGDGPLDLVYLGALTVPVDLFWEEPSFDRFARRLQGFSRTVWCETRGMGASGGNFQDRFVDEVFDADLTAVLDAVGCERVALIGASYGGATAIRYAATHPERVSSLVLIDTWAHYVREDDYPWGLSPDFLDRYSASATEVWGTGAALEVMAPSRVSDERFRAWWARGERLGVGVDQIAVAVRAGFLRDVRALLPTLALPTLVLHRAGDRYIRVGAGRYLGEHIPGAKYVELSGDDHLFFVGDTDALLDEIEEFLTGSHQAPEGDVILAAVLFTDIVASTEQSARMGHRKWNTLTHDHDAMIRATLRAVEVMRSRPSATGSSPPSMPPHGPCARRRRSWPRRTEWVWTCGPVSTPARSRSGPMTWSVCQSASPSASVTSPTPEKCSSLEP